MTRPADLPDYVRPPIHEVAIGVQFQPLTLTGADIGIFWLKFRDQFPNVAEQPPLPPRVENFSAPTAPEFAFGFGVPSPRFWFSTADQIELLQVQSDRLLFNWRRVSADQPYPHFEAIQQKFDEHYKRWRAFLHERGLAANVGQWEVSYVNRIASQDGPLLVDDVMSFLAPQLRSGLGGAPEATQLSSQRVLLDASGTPWARAYVSAQNGVEPSGTLAVIFELTVRGPLQSNAAEGVLATAQLEARRWIVNAFDNLTDPSMHKLWGKKS